MPVDKLYLDTPEASDHLKDIGLPISPATLACMRSTGTGPKFVRFGRYPKYTAEWLEEFALSRLAPPDEDIRLLNPRREVVAAAPRDDAPAPKAAAPVRQAPAPKAARTRGRPRRGVASGDRAATTSVSARPADTD